MSISAKVICDSISNHGIRITTLQLHFPRIILAEVNTHGALAKNARSTRAVPTNKLIEEVRNNPFIPLKWGLNKSGMQSEGEADDNLAAEMKLEWRTAAKVAATQAKILFDLGLHKQWAGRLLEPFMWVDSVVTATDWTNFDALRNHSDAQPEFEALAKAIKEARANSTPKLLQPGEWHLPYIDLYKDEVLVKEYPENERVDIYKKLSAARCARVSYAPFDGDGSIDKELKRFDMLITSQPVHASPVEHQATPDSSVMVWNDCKKEPSWKNKNEWGRFYGWRQFRKMIPGNTVLDEHYA